MKTVLSAAVILLAVSLAACSISQSISEKEAISIAKAVVPKNERLQIIDYDKPEAMLKAFQESHSVMKHGDKQLVDLKDKTVWKITFKTELDGLLGPITLYIDAYSGEVYGADLRY